MKKLLLLAGLIVMSFSGSIYTNDGRFELSQISEMRRDQFLVDTQTGKTWVYTLFNDNNSTNKEDGYLAFSPVLYDSPLIIEGGTFRPDNAGIKNKNGRYRLKQISNFRRDQYMLDTETGRVWTIVVDKNEKIFFQQTLLLDTEDYLKKLNKKRK